MLNTWESVKTKAEREAEKKKKKKELTKEDKKKKECYNCKKKGHIQAECRGVCKWKKCEREGTHARKDCYKPNKKSETNSGGKSDDSKSHDALFGLWLMAGGSDQGEDVELEEVREELEELNIASITDFPPLPTRPIPSIHTSTTTPTTSTSTVSETEIGREIERVIGRIGAWAQGGPQHDPFNSPTPSHTSHSTHSYTSSHLQDLDRKHHGGRPYEGIDSAGARGQEEAERETSYAALLRAEESPRETRPTPATGNGSLGAGSEGKTSISDRETSRSTTHTQHLRTISEQEYKHALLHNEQAEYLTRFAEQWNDSVTNLIEWTRTEKIVQYKVLHEDLTEHGSRDEMLDLVEDCNFTVVGPPDWDTRVINECDVCRGRSGDGEQKETGLLNLSSPLLPIDITYDHTTNNFVVTLPVHSVVTPHASNSSRTEREIEEQEEEDDEEDSEDSGDDTDLPSLEGDSDKDNDDEGSGAGTGGTTQEGHTSQDNENHQQNSESEERQPPHDRSDGWGHNTDCIACISLWWMWGENIVKGNVTMPYCECRTQSRSAMDKGAWKCSARPATRHQGRWGSESHQQNGDQYITCTHTTDNPNKTNTLMWSHMYNTYDEDWMFQYDNLPDLISSSDDETDEDDEDDDDELACLAAEDDNGKTQHITNIVDSGASRHIVCHEQEVKEKKKVPPRAFNTASGAFSLDTTTTTSINVYNHSYRERDICLKDAFICDKIKRMNLVSVSELDTEGK